MASQRCGHIRLTKKNGEGEGNHCQNQSIHEEVIADAEILVLPATNISEKGNILDKPSVEESRSPIIAYTPRS